MVPYPLHDAGGGNYQTLINNALRDYIQQQDSALARTLRKVIRERLALVYNSEMYCAVCLWM